MMNRPGVLSPALLLALLFASTSLGQEAKLKETHVLEGRIVAYDSLASFANSAAGMPSQILVMKLIRKLKGKETAQYIQVHYLHPRDHQAPEDFFNGKAVWRFSLARAGYCDGRLGDLDYLMAQGVNGMKYKTSTKRLKATGGWENEKIPLDTKTPCYLLLNDFRVAE